MQKPKGGDKEKKLRKKIIKQKTEERELREKEELKKCVIVSVSVCLHSVDVLHPLQVIVAALRCTVKRASRRRWWKRHDKSSTYTLCIVRLCSESSV